ncbi:hypothetical protein QLL95_gp1175 [Cotonvirus japonicus]|uniref:Uncharacterized protein n=1 Tax=Cotonvirus japonicus TaxID=2811091 RepID=A0ABM7NS10_9VIRU|nr:hypothetical protein QLL95_gp1175 [Cotonvirus japonicus]BCS82948.1 hypothetical protein [Cotonvirus japonicus]
MNIKNNYFLLRHNVFFAEPNINSTHYELYDVVKEIYKILTSDINKINENLMIVLNTEIIKYYMNCPITKFNISINSGLNIYNDTTNIKILDIYPEFCALDEYLSKNNIKFMSPENKQINKTKNFINKLPETKCKIQKNRPKEIQQESQQEIQQESQQESQQEIQLKKPSTLNDNKKNISSSKIKLFESDKLAYFMIKKDIEHGIIQQEEINPWFATKYIVFKILDSRKKLDMINNINIKNEYEQFMELYQECIDEEQTINLPIEIPYNYHYMTPENKEILYKKYGVTKQEFEDKYLNKNEDIITDN